MARATLAEKAKISNEFMSAVERGAKVPSLDVLARIAAGLRVEIKDLFNVDRLPYHRLEFLSKDVVDLAIQLQRFPSATRKVIVSILRLNAQIDEMEPF
jgi:transcriptional regulator with XRE-family HTH domain